MKIISKYKDYYDYLTGIYGEDPKLILDRREGVILDPFYPHDIDKAYGIAVYICGWKIEGYRLNNKYLFGNRLLILDSGQRDKKCSYEHITVESISRWNTKGYSRLIIEPIKDPNQFNIVHDCPILFKSSSNFIKFPRLDDLGIANVVPPELIYQWLSLWLGAKLDKEQIIKDNLSDVQKLENKGFDKIISFRPHIKK